MLVIFILEVFSIGFIELLSENLHFLIKSVDNVLNFIVDFFLGALLVLLLFDFSPNVPPSTKSFDKHSSVVTSLSLCELYL